MFLVERRASPFLIVYGQKGMSTQWKLWPGVGLESQRWSTIGSDGWLLNVIVLRSSFLAGPFTDRVTAGTPPPQMNFLMRLSPGLVIGIHGSERLGKGAKGWPS